MVKRRIIEETVLFVSVACVISFLMTGHRSVYPSQLLSVRKSESINVQVGEEIQDIEATYEPRESMIARLAMMVNKLLTSKLQRKK